MMQQPDTRSSLILRIRDADDREAWTDFSNIYRPAIVQMARMKGLQNSDAEDLAQSVLISIAKAIKGFDVHSNRARFRTWLHRVTHNAILNAITRRAPDQGSGDTETLRSIEQNSVANDPDSGWLSIEIRRQLFSYAAKQIESEFSVSTWKCFWLTAVLEKSIDDTARKLSTTRGSIYAARSRVMKRLKTKILELQLDPEIPKIESEFESS